jgi:hypothetical protein
MVSPNTWNQPGSLKCVTVLLLTHLRHKVTS